METIFIPQSSVPHRFGSYQHHVIENGHEPGVLSGAELQGLAKQWAGKYRASRDSVERFVEEGFNVKSRLIFSEERKRFVRVWADQNGNPVKIIIPLTSHNHPTRSHR